LNLKKTSEKMNVDNANHHCCEACCSRNRFFEEAVLHLGGGEADRVLHRMLGKSEVIIALERTRELIALAEKFGISVSPNKNSEAQEK
jgi:hypothetical protein